MNIYEIVEFEMTLDIIGFFKIFSINYQVITSPVLEWTPAMKGTLATNVKIKINACPIPIPAMYKVCLWKIEEYENDYTTL